MQQAGISFRACHVFCFAHTRTPSSWYARVWHLGEDGARFHLPATIKLTMPRAGGGREERARRPVWPPAGTRPAVCWAPLLLLIVLAAAALCGVQGQALSNNYGWTSDTATSVSSSLGGRVGAASVFVANAPNSIGLTDTLFVFGGQTQATPSSPLAGGSWSLLGDMWSRGCVRDGREGGMALAAGDGSDRRVKIALNRARGG